VLHVTPQLQLQLRRHMQHTYTHLQQQLCIQDLAFPTGSPPLRFNSRRSSSSSSSSSSSNALSTL